MSTEYSTEDNLLEFQRCTITHVNRIEELEGQVKRLEDVLELIAESC